MPTLPLVVKFPLAVVVALPPTQRLFATERFEVEALEKEVRPVMERVPVAVMLVAVRLPPKNPLPLTERLVKGLDVPIPTFPLARTEKSDAPEDEATLNGSAAGEPWIDNV